MSDSEIKKEVEDEEEEKPMEKGAAVKLRKEISESDEEIDVDGFQSAGEAVQKQDYRFHESEEKKKLEDARKRKRQENIDRRNEGHKKNRLVMDEVKQEIKEESVDEEVAVQPQDETTETEEEIDVVGFESEGETRENGGFIDVVGSASDAVEKQEYWRTGKEASESNPVNNEMDKIASHIYWGNPACGEFPHHSPTGRRFETQLVSVL